MHESFSSFGTGPKRNDLWANIDFFSQTSTIKYEKTPKHETKRFTLSNQDRRWGRKSALSHCGNARAKEQVRKAMPVAFPMRVWKLKINKWSNLRMCFSNLNLMCGGSLVAQLLGICLPMQGTRVRALVWEDPTCRGATGPVGHNYWACASGACAPQQERPWQWEARAPWWRVAPAFRN